VLQPWSARDLKSIPLAAKTTIRSGNAIPSEPFAEKEMTLILKERTFFDARYFYRIR
jgi:hypothetical protein